jgi:hypothetical protein
MRTIRALRSALLVAAAALSSGACYHQIVETGRTPGTQVIDKPWQMSFVYGLVPPPAIDAAAQCPGGVARVETQHSFLNGLVAAISFGIVTPMRVTVTCAGGGRTGALPATPSATPRTPAERQALLESAVVRSGETGAAVLVQL